VDTRIKAGATPNPNNFSELSVWGDSFKDRTNLEEPNAKPTLSVLRGGDQNTVLGRKIWKFFRDVAPEKHLSDTRTNDWVQEKSVLELG
jgi:hypothetical protein